MSDWTPQISSEAGPIYRGLADAIAGDIKSGRLRPGDRLPPLRRLAEFLEIDLTTVSRGYAEAQSRGLIESQVGRGTFVADTSRRTPAGTSRRGDEIDMTMNLPPEPKDPALLARMREGLSAVSADLTSLLRYQSPVGADIDRQAASGWLAQRGLDVEPDRIAITPGTNATIFAILSVIARDGGVVLSEAITYPGAQAIARRCGCRLVGLEEDADGITPEALEQAIGTHRPRALYLNPTLNNPTTRTMPLNRRQDIAAVLRRHGLPLIEDDACGALPVSAPPPIAFLAPELTWFIGGLAKIFGGGLRLAFTVAPDARCAYQLGQALKTTAVMPPMLSAAVMTHWIENGTADLVRDFVRAETAARQAIAGDILKNFDVEGQPEALNIWLRLPEGTSRADMVARMQGMRIGILPSDPFVVSGERPEALRICLGGPIDQEELRTALSHLANTLVAGYWHG
ncbi:PLP-dependent aminotransferase family protein [Paracoccus shandongensis]|uniref:aminotransferase-like domain-containing protein n=1 Tax=Paracoccus shandongensis TaxID=2816048 RepID=UPI001A8EC7B9|nr:PLP-dependent aminotransferase family protein [Paracoccus shandongensis]